MAKLKRKIKKYQRKLKKNKAVYFEIIIFLLILIIVFSLTIYSLNDVRYNVIFDSTGGTTITSKKIKSNNLVKEPLPPTREGYLFLGWYLNDELYDFNLKVTDDLKLEAKWELIEMGEIEVLELNVIDFKVGINKQLELPLTIIPTYIENEKIYWESSNPDIIEVDSKGVITTKKYGKATITASTSNGLVDQVNIIVSKNIIDVDSVNFVKNEITISVNDKIALEYMIEPVNSTNKNVVWESDNNEVIEIDNNGTMRAKNLGSAMVTVKTVDGEKKAICQVNVVDEDK